MRKIDMNSNVDMVFSLRWKSDTASHTDCYQASGINIWRDYFPDELLGSLLGKEPGERIEIDLKKSETVPGFDDGKLFAIKRSQFEPHLDRQHPITPRIGRFYPKGMVKGVSDVYRSNIQPFRLVGINNGHMTVDFNHPMAGRKINLSCIVGKVEAVKVERGGTSIDWIETLINGPGMQARWRSQATDYFTENAFGREDNQPDEAFYRLPRLVQHIDDTAVEMVRNTYDRFLSSGMRVLDLMSSWQSHVPANVRLDTLVGLGLNAEELKRNSQLTDFIVKDLNAERSLPFADNAFDMVLNTVSVEYLIDPVNVFREIERILRPGGHFVVTFSNRWFPTKAIHIWEQLHEFERMGLVLEYFMRSGGFENLHTYSFRGLPRPHTDRYYPQLRFSDPLYAVWGQKKPQ